MVKSPVVDRINDIAWQAHQGSVAAIIQLLNEKLANSGVRTRAIFSDGVLQLLCEAAKTEQLEQNTIVERIQQILETIAPRNIRKVHINSRIVREQQLLWLKEICSDRENQVLWSQEITLIQPNALKQLITDLTEVQPELVKVSLPKNHFSRTSVFTNKKKHKNLSKTGILATAGLFSIFLLGWVVYAQLGDKLTQLTQPETKKSVTTANPNQNKTKATNNNLSESSDEPFIAAVRIANQASASGKIATTSTQWLELAAKWQQASDLMATVPPNYNRHQEAKIRTQLYKKYSEAAQKEAAKSKS
ncbi:hypothetical protein [Halotia branconii]|uniref:Uncharacterized protein n=1 Tax=Halotia branconii CENA392 TaxID=1539056 RepID=A0AAJ6NUC6_9CYAN|nr:hypothetical protein [Halotia branconii]WGV26676.1 hypothetical protein QI031_03985 [Halotia branconii CENA392]